MKSIPFFLFIANLAFTLNHCSFSTAADDLPQVPPRLNGGYWIEREAEKVVDAKLGVTISTPSFSADTWIFAMPEPPETPGQDVLEFVTKPDSQSISDKTPLQRPIRRCRIDVATEELRQQASFDCEYKLRLYNRTLRRGRKPRKHQADSLEDEDRKRYLRASKECDYRSDSFQTWKSANKFQRGRRQGEVEFALAVFRSIAKQYSYLYVPKQDRTASALCQTNQTDCGGLSTLFVTTMRSEGIPARLLSGRWAESAVEGETVDGQRYYKYHVIAEFYAQGVGWVPVDLSSSILHDRTATQERFFGKDPANFIVMHVDTGVEFDTDLYGDYRAVFFQIPLFWTRGKGSIDDRKLDERWTVNVDSSDASVAGSGKQSRGSARPKASYVFLPITHLRQGENMCAPTSASMALLHHGARIPPARIKALANAVTTKPDFPGTYFEDLVGGLKQVGISWELKYFKTNTVGFEAGLKKIIESLDAGNPVIIDTNIPPHGHTVLVNGYDPQRKMISIVDPLIAGPGLRRLSYVEFERAWRSLTADIRGVIITSAPKQR